MRGPSREGIAQLNKLSLNIQVKKMKVEWTIIEYPSEDDEGGQKTEAAR